MPRRFGLAESDVAIRKRTSPGTVEFGVLNDEYQDSYFREV